MQNKYKIIIAIVLLATSFAVGRYTVPEKVRVKKQIVEVEKKDKKSETDANKHKEIKVIEVTHLDGTKETTTTTVEDDTSKTKTAEKDKNSSSESDSSETVRGDSKVTVSALIGSPLVAPLLPVYGMSVTKPILGPIAFGLWGLTNKTAGVSLGLTF